MRFYVFMTLSFLSLKFCDAVIYSWIWNINPVPHNTESNYTKDSNYSTNGVLPVCKKDKHCGDGKFCHRHYGICRNCKELGSRCRRDHMCCAGMECVFGLCRKIILPGLTGAKCKRDRSCGKGLCCAKGHGEWICKPMLKVGALCSVPEGGIEYAINHSCPCGEGLDCKKIRFSKKERSKLAFIRKLRKCQKVE